MARLENLTDRGIETQNTFRAALIDLILEKGYESVSIKDITDRTGFERTTFYLHFKSKEDLLAKTQHQALQEFAGIDPRSQVPTEALRSMFLHIQDHRRTYQAVLKAEALAGAEGRILENGIQETVVGGVLSRLAPVGGVNRDLAAYFVAASLRSLTVWWLDQKSPCTPGEMAETALALVTRGLDGIYPGISFMTC